MKNLLKKEKLCLVNACNILDNILVDNRLVILEISVNLTALYTGFVYSLIVISR